jgi:SagB-type dehydrogenase family enzyme
MFAPLPSKEVMKITSSVIGAAIANNSVKELSPNFSSSGLRTFALNHRTLDMSDDNRLAETFLINTRLRRNDAEAAQSIADYFTDEALAMLSLHSSVESDCSDALIALPKPISIQMKMGEAMGKRRSHRQFTDVPIDQKILSTLLYAAGGITGKGVVAIEDDDGEASLDISFRSTPSGGGLYPNELYIFSKHVEGLPENSTYRYLPKSHSLEPVANDGEQVDRLNQAFASSEDQISVSQAAAIIYIVGLPWRSMRKYGARGMRFLFMEAGYMSQNFHLAALGLGCASCDVGAIYDNDVHAAFGFDGCFQALTHTLIVGMPAR